MWKVGTLIVDLTVVVVVVAEKSDRSVGLYFLLSLLHFSVFRFVSCMNIFIFLIAFLVSLHLICSVWSCLFFGGVGGGGIVQLTN